MLGKVCVGSGPDPFWRHYCGGSDLSKDLSLATEDHFMELDWDGSLLCIWRTLPLPR